MSHKTSPARRAAFFQALRATGNQTLACERTKVSRSWVQLQRSIDPQFKADVVAAVEEARVSLSQRSASSAEHGEQSGRKPPSGWGHLDGEELVVKGTGGVNRTDTPMRAVGLDAAIARGLADVAAGRTALAGDVFDRLERRYRGLESRKVDPGSIPG